MSINTVCEDVQLLNIVNIFKNIINFGTIIVPVVLVVFIIIDIIKTIINKTINNFFFIQITFYLSLIIQF